VYLGAQRRYINTLPFLSFTYLLERNSISEESRFLLVLLEIPL